VALAVCLLFDRRSERVIRALWDQLESLGVPSLRSHTHGRHVPHLSYAVLRRWDLASVTAALSGLDAGSHACRRSRKSAPLHQVIARKLPCGKPGPDARAPCPRA